MLRKKLILLILLLPAIKVLSQKKEVPTPQWRPKYHFTPEKNWTNDPNGLLFLNGEFQLYYQHNPFENKWGHMSWGHATSKDMIQWRHLPVAIPEIVTKDTTTWIYSGSAVVDKNNTSGFGINGKPPIIAIFTADQPKQHKESQFIAYSNNNGLSYTQYSHNPVIDLNKSDFRDPNVFWYEPAKQWIMTVSMVNEHMVRIYGSKNLKEWTRLSDFGPAGYTRNGWECPSLLPLVVDNDPKNIKWVMLVSSGGDHGPLIQYFVGDFDGETFKDDNNGTKVLPVDYGDAFYAAIAWRDAPQNKKVLLGWMQDGRRETYPWKGQMSIPHDLSLKTTEEGLRLVQEPSSFVTKSLAKYSTEKALLKKNMPINDTRINLSKERPFAGNSYWIEAEFAVDKAKKVGFNIVENPDITKNVTVGYDAEHGQLFIDCTISEMGNKSRRNLEQRAPLKAINGVVKIQVLVDNSSLEVFGNGGEKVISTMIYPDINATNLSVFAEGKAVIKNMKIWDFNQK
ncbi:glycoside hydrolase family 32 protein [Mucilaginibacter sp. UR6-11]|uniref:glycoside hydrolase family 32 protein n=1 Tax=Mucilaginibacter sp. UR6-11 TaxID=1435644 RepID=UPI001E3FC946|nr:glycoside hydrolase family 32 protein [Mucilaginibacter sp. UR6-11]MCC8425370.1 glycoside hydrolase family 32 protein [Mucilaginibacter sp. UR6-11]